MSYKRNFFSKSTFKTIIIGSFAGGSLLLASNDKTRKDTYLGIQAAYRVVNLLSTVGIITTDYIFSIYGQNTEKNESVKLEKELKSIQNDQEVVTFNMWQSKDPTEIKMYQAKIQSNRDRIDEISELLADNQAKGLSVFSSVHQRCATRLREMCTTNKGIYIKLGQHISMLDHMIPEEYQLELSKLLANNPISSYESIQRIFKEDFGQLPEEVFQSFSPAPIASASLAQVHIAYDKYGKKYAVKVQHEGLLEGSVVDRYIVTILVDLLSRMFEGFDYNWLSREMNTNLPMELDFKCEFKNIERITKCLKKEIDEQDVVIPSAYSEMTSNRVLTMSFEEGFYPSEIGKIHSNGLKSSDVARLISRTFAEQIFRHGFVHCDPHEANMLIRCHPTKPGKPQLVLLDHGLYKQLPDNFRRSYCRLWRALVCSDEQAIKRHCTELNAGKLFTLLSAILTMRTWDDITSNDIRRLKGKYSAGESKMLQSYAKKYFKEIVGLLGAVPPELLLLLKTNDCLRHIDRKLGAPINTATVIADITSQVILYEDKSDCRDMISLYQCYNNYLQVLLRLGGLKLLEIQIYMKDNFYFFNLI